MVKLDYKTFIVYKSLLIFFSKNHLFTSISIKQPNMDPVTNDGSPKTAVAKKLPGPFRWPIFGSLFHLTGFKERVFMDWTEHYGDIYRVKVGSKDVVVVNGLVVD